VKCEGDRLGQKEVFVPVELCLNGGWSSSMDCLEMGCPLKLPHFEARWPLYAPSDNHYMWVFQEGNVTTGEGNYKRETQLRPSTSIGPAWDKQGNECLSPTVALGNALSIHHSP
jgi:hypothetical protein